MGVATSMSPAARTAWHRPARPWVEPRRVGGPAARRRIAGVGLTARMAAILGALVLVQAALFYDHFAVAITLLFGMGIGVWLRSWTAGFWAVGAFLLSFVIAVATGWLQDARPIAEPLLGGGIAFLGGVIGGGIFQVLGWEAPGEGPAGPPV